MMLSPLRVCQVRLCSHHILLSGIQASVFSNLALAFGTVLKKGIAPGLGHFMSIQQNNAIMSVIFDFPGRPETNVYPQNVTMV